MSNAHASAAPPKLTLRRAKHSLARWWFIPVSLAVLAALAGGLSANMTRPTAETLVSLSSTQTDAIAMSRVSETMVRQLRTDAVFVRAAQLLGENADSTDLYDRTRIAAVPSTMMISVQVMADDTDRAAVEADAIVKAVQQLETDARDSEVDRVTAQIRKLMSSRDAKVSDTAAEDNRVRTLGNALADAQASAATTDDQLTVVQTARAVSGGVGPITLAVACGLGGALLGGGIALLLGARRGKVRSLVELEEIYPQVPAIAPALLNDVLAVEGDQITTILVSGTAASRDRLTDLRDRIAMQLLSNPVSGRDLNVLAAPLSDAVVRRVTTDPSVLLVVGVDPAAAQLEDLAWLDRLPSRAYLLELPGSV